MDFDSIARQCRALAYAGKTYDEILAQINIQELPPSQIKQLRSLIDDFLVQYQLAEQVRNRYKTQMMLGGVAAFFGLFILLFAYLRNELKYSLGIGIAVTLLGLNYFNKGYTKWKEPIDFQDIIPKKDSKFRRY